MQSMYIRVKRQKLTIFLQVDASDTVLEVKQKLQPLIEQVSTTRRGMHQTITAVTGS